jgi:hypothetical protein
MKTLRAELTYALTIFELAAVVVLYWGGWL